MSAPPRRLYLLALLAVLCGALLSWLFRGSGRSDQIESMERLEVPGEIEVRLQPGQHLLYLEPPEVDSVRCRIEDPRGRPLELAPAVAAERYAEAGRRGRAFAGFTARAPGRHRLDCLRESPGGGAASVAVGRGFGSSLPIVLIPAAVGLLLCLTISLIVFSKRRSRA